MMTPSWQFNIFFSKAEVLGTFYVGFDKVFTTLNKFRNLIMTKQLKAR